MVKLQLMQHLLNYNKQNYNKQYAALQHYKKQYRNRKARKPSGLRAFF
jgi:hypothetical protein